MLAATMRQNRFIFCDYPLAYALGFQDPATNWMYAIIDLHDQIIFFLLILQVIVGWFQTSAQTNKDHLFFLAHGNQIEQIWTITPAGILWAIGLPSLKLLYMMDEIQDAEVTIKAIANQWYSNAINKVSFFANRNKILRALSNENSHNSKSFERVLDPCWVTGFVDAEGCFSVNISLRKDGRRKIAVGFIIALEYKDLDIQYALKTFFTVGRISIQKNEARQEILGYKNAIDYILPHFDQYSQYTGKLADYLLWREIVLIQNSQQHLIEKGFLQCVAIKASLNKGQNRTQQIAFPGIKPISRPTVSQPNVINPHWLSGFTAGDGSFLVTIKKSATHITGYQVQPTFDISQHVKDVEQQRLMGKFQGRGNVYIYGTEAKLVVTKFRDLSLIKTHFSSYPLNNVKNHSFLIWCEIINLIKDKKHQTIEGLELIRRQREKMRIS